jgi:hypothetical protein
MAPNSVVPQCAYPIVTGNRLATPADGDQRTHSNTNALRKPVATNVEIVVGYKI